MKTDKLNGLRASKPFHIKDIFIYLAVFITVTVLFCLFVIFPNKTKNDGFSVYCGDELVLVLEFDNPNPNVCATWQDKVQFNSKNNTVKIFFDDAKTDYNVICFDTTNRSVRVTESTCSTSKDCVYTPAITGSNGMIFCAPHNLRITPLSSGAIPPVVG